MNQLYQIYKHEPDFEDGYISCGPLPHKYLSKHQAELKIKTLDPYFLYTVSEVLENKFIAINNFFTTYYTNPIEDITIMTNASRRSFDLYVVGYHIDCFDSMEECKEALKTLGADITGLP